MKLDTNLAWRQASAAVSANRDVLLPLAGVFFLLPRLALTLFMPEPPTHQGMAPEALMAMMQTYYMQILPYVLPMAVFQAVGSLALIALFTDTSRPTVGRAIAMGARCVVPYLLAELLFSFAVGLAGGLGLALGALSPALMVLLPVVAVVAGYGFVRLSLLAPVVVAEGQLNPVRALRRSWLLTQGNALPIFLFLMLLVMVLMVVMLSAVSVGGVLTTLAVNAEWAKIATSLIGAVLGAIYAAYSTAAIAAIHRQLAGPGLGALQQTFE